MSNNDKKAVVLHSGGLDSTVLLWELMSRDIKVLPLSIHYGQRHLHELDMASLSCAAGKLTRKVVDLGVLSSLIGGSGSSQVNPNIAVPDGHYSDDNMATTVVPNRNMMLISTAVMYAIAEHAEFVAYAAHAGDHAQYPDCRQEFIDALAQAIALCDYSPPSLLAPFSAMTKADIVRRGHELGAPLHLSYSCYKGGPTHCGRCGTDVERAEAFYLAGVPDPTTYDDSNYWMTVCGVGVQ